MTYSLKQSHSMTRRRFLRGSVQGLGLSLALPFLESLSGWAPEAYANGAFPKRFCLFFWGNGVLPNRWVPMQTGDIHAGIPWNLSPQLSPLQSHQSHINVLSGLEVKAPNIHAHLSGPAGFLSGMEETVVGDYISFTQASIDQVIAQEIGQDTLYRSLEVGVQPGVKGLSFSGLERQNPSESDPQKLFDRLFGTHFTAPGETPIFDPSIGLRRSLLDAIMEDGKALQKQLSKYDQERLDQHLTAIRELEVRLARLEEDPPSLAACVRPSPPINLPDLEGRTPMKDRAKLIADLVSMSFACDLTRVASIWYSDPVSNILYEGMEAGHHKLTHDEIGEQLQVNQIVQNIMGSFSDLLDSFTAVEEGDGTLLDHSLTLATSDVSYGRTHSLDEYPIVLAGSCGNTLKTGLHHRFESAENACQVSLSILEAMGITKERFGNENVGSDQSIDFLKKR
jgi:hypothetical protein